MALAAGQFPALASGAAGALRALADARRSTAAQRDAHRAKAGERAVAERTLDDLAAPLRARQHKLVGAA